MQWYLTVSSIWSTRAPFSSGSVLLRSIWRSRSIQQLRMASVRGTALNHLSQQLKFLSQRLTELMLRP